MLEDIKVHVLRKPGRKNLYLRYRDPVTGKDVTKSAGTHLKKEADKAAGKWESELREGRYKPASKITWEEFTERHADEAQPALADNTADLYVTAFESIRTTLGITKLTDLNECQIAKWQNALRDREFSEQTIKSYSGHLKAALNWAVEVSILPTAPKVSMPKRAKGAKLMKGRAITAEEFDRMIEKVPSVVGDDRTADWQHFLRGLWWSGLRIGEAIELTWDGNGLRVEFVDGEPYLMIPADSQKSAVAQLLPIAPEFAEMLLAVPDEARTGFVFNLPMARDTGARRTNTVGKVVTDIGEKANIVVNRTKRAGTAITKFASAHDLRRPFSRRWASRTMRADLQTLMRHASIQTSVAFCVAKDARDLTKRLRTAIGDTLADTNQKSANAGALQKPQTH